MARLTDYIGRALDSNWLVPVSLGVMTAIVLTGETLRRCYGRRTKASISQNPPTYRDVNGDGVIDKIVQRRVEVSRHLELDRAWGTSRVTLEDEVLFGVDIDGIRIYLTKDQFEEPKK